MPLFPFISLAIYLVIWSLMSLGILPDISTLFDFAGSLDPLTLLGLMGIIIALESIMYIGFYLPGQFIAVILVVATARSWVDILALTLISIVAVTLSAWVNYTLGSLFRTRDDTRVTPIDWKKLLLSMIHINTLALALFEAGKNHAPPRIIALVGLLNLPYYLLLIALTYTFQDAVMELWENPYYLLIALLIWCGYSVYRYKRGIHPVSPWQAN
jgi:membrane-associated protein